MPFFKKKSPSSTYTDEYGNINFISFLGTVYSRLAYMNDHQFLLYYKLIFGPIIPVSLMQQINTQVKTNGINSINDDKKMLNLSDDLKPYVYKTDESSSDLELKTYKSDDGELHVQFLPLAQKINQTTGEERISDKEPNCELYPDPNNLRPAVPDEFLVFSSISTSNYGEIYIIGDKRMPNIINVVFRGTYSGKSAASYSSPLSVSPAFVGFTEEKAEKYLFGVFKLLTDVIHILVDNIIYVGKQINPDASLGDINIFTSGHSLGGGLSTIFAYLWVAHLTSQKSFNSSPYNILNPNICCVSVGSPRVMDNELADIFCCLTSNVSVKSDKCNELIAAINKYNERTGEIDIKGRILFYRVTSYHDPVPGLPKHGTFTHPCSNEKVTGPNMREKITSDCYVQISNSVSDRCGIKSNPGGLASGKSKPALTVDYNLPLNCVNTKDKRSKSKFNSPHLVNFMGYHTMYLGVIFIGALDLGTFAASAFVSREVKRVGDKDTVCRLIMYPNPISKDVNKAGVVYYNLVKLRSKSVFDAINDSEMGDTNTKEDSKAPPHTSNYGKLKLLMSSTKTPIPISEDIGATYKTFEILYNKCIDYNILTENPSVEFTGNLQEITSTEVDPTFTYFAIAGKRRRQKSKKNYRKTRKIRKNRKTRKN